MANRLEDVFGLIELRPYSYVDRGNLDAHANYLLRTGRHIVIHGDSKQGKSWLRERMLPDDTAIRVQCDRDSTAVTVLQQALGLLGVKAEVRYTKERSITGTIDLGASGEFGSSLFAKATATGRLSGTRTGGSSTDYTPVGRTPADMSWIAFVFRESGRRLVLEDFHYLSSQEQQRFAFQMKALGEYGAPVIVVGVWAEDHLLGYHNGDLVGRVEDLRLSWTDDELGDVLQKGGDALNIAFDDRLRREMTSDAIGNVGVLQRLAERFCYRSGVFESSPGAKRILGDETVLNEARVDLAAQMAGRFVTFADRLSSRRPSYQDIVRVATEAADEELVGGIALRQLVRRCNAVAGRQRYTLPIMRDRLLQLGEIQAAEEVFPPVLSFDQVNNQLFLVDRALLFYRRYGAPEWTWLSEPEGEGL